MYFDPSAFDAQISVSCALVKRVPLKFGIGLALRHTMSFRIQKPKSCTAAPTRKMLWYDPITQIVPVSLSTRCACASQPRVNASYAA